MYYKYVNEVAHWHNWHTYTCMSMYLFSPSRCLKNQWNKRKTGVNWKISSLKRHFLSRFLHPLSRYLARCFRHYNQWTEQVELPQDVPEACALGKTWSDPLFHWIGFREYLEETIVFACFCHQMWVFPVNFPLNQSNDRGMPFTIFGVMMWIYFELLLRFQLGILLDVK